MTRRNLIKTITLGSFLPLNLQGEEDQYVQLCPLNIPMEHSGRIYTEENFRTAISEKQEWFVEIYNEHDIGISLNNAVGIITDLQIKDNHLVGKYKVIKKIDNTLKIRPKGTGRTVELLKIENYLLIGFQIV